MPKRDFTRQREDVSFTVDGDEFKCWPSLAGDDLKTLGAVLSQGVTVENVLDYLDQVFQIVMVEESYIKYRQRMTDRARALDIIQIKDIVEWLVEVYTDRPTMSPSDSSSGSLSGDTGSDSTDGARGTVSIPLP